MKCLLMEIDCCFSQLYFSALKILVDNNEDRLMLIYNQGLQMLTEAFHTLHVMYHEATACHVTADIVDLLSILVSVLKVGRNYIDQKKGKGNTDKDLTKPTVKTRNSLFGYCKSGNFRENFIFGNITKRHICDT